MSLRSLYHGSGSTRFLGEYLSTRLKIRDFLDIPEHIVREYLTPKNYEKPKIEIGNYYLNWNHDSYGIQQKEVTELKLFLKNAITYFEIIFVVLNDLQKSRDLQKRRLSRELNPLVRILHNNKDHIVSYDLYMARDGSTFIDRLERIEICKENEFTKDNRIFNREYSKSVFHLKWNIGEVLFSRQRAH